MSGGNGQLRAVHLWHRIAVLWALLSLPLFAFADITSGVNWLATQPNANGSYGGTATSLAAPLQTTAEALRAYQAMGETSQPPYAPALNYLNNDTEVNTEFLPRKIIVNKAAGNDVTALVNTLLTHRNADGGFGDQPGYDSSVLDTAYALQALSALNYNAGSTIAEAVGYLLSRQQSGSFADGDNNPSVFLTANAFRALFPYRNTYTGVSAALTNAQNYLLTQRDGAGNFGENFNTALALLALIPNVIDITPLNSSIGALEGAQLANGSWDNDAYTTALALQALWLASHRPPRTDVAVIQGSVIDAITRLPLAGVNVALTGPVSRSLTTGSDGAFRFADLPFGTYTLAFTLNGYSSLSTVTTAPNGQTFNLGALALTQNANATTGTVRGTVKDGATNLPLAGVSVSVTGGLSATTDANGDYQISNVTPAQLTATANKSGYSIASGTGNLVAGGTLVFSPTLFPVATATTAIQGTVTDGATGALLSGVTITISGSTQASVVTNAQGFYRVESLVPGSITITATLAGYDTVIANAPVVENSILQFSPRLYAQNTTPPDANASGVRGTVLDVGTDQPLEGVAVQVSVGGVTRTFTTAANGQFEITGLPSGSSVLTFTRTDYLLYNLSVGLQPATVLDIGQVRLRKAAAPVLLPDLIVSLVDGTSAVNDPQTLQLSGTLAVTIRNRGTLGAPADVRVLAFYDTNTSNSYQPGVDTLLGEASIAGALPIGADVAISIPLSGQLPFRDALIHVWVDSAQTVAESNEANNVGITTSVCTEPTRLSSGGTILNQDRSVFTQFALGYSFGVGPDGKIGLFLRDPADRRLGTRSTVSIRPDEWSHVAATWNGSTTGGVTLYVNGIPTVTTTSTVGSFTGLGGPSPSLRSGANHGDSANNISGYDGKIDHLSLWRGTLTPAQIAADYQCAARPEWKSTGAVQFLGGWEFEGNHNDASGNGYNLSPVGTVPFVSGTCGGLAADFNGGTAKYPDSAGIVDALDSAGSPGGRPELSSFNATGMSIMAMVKPRGLATTEPTETYTVRTVAGNGASGYSGDGGPATAAGLPYPTGVAVDANGNLYIADGSNNRVRKVSPNGIITTVAGNGNQGFSGDGGPATAASLHGPHSVAVDTNGNLFIADTSNHRVRKVNPDGIIITVAGIGFTTIGVSGDGGPATAAGLYAPFGVAVDAQGNLYIANYNHHRVRKVSPNGIITTVAGNGNQGFSGDGGPATAASLNNPHGVAVDANGNLYIADGSNNRVRKVSPNGIITTVAGNGNQGFSGDGGPATAAGLYGPVDVAVDTNGNLFIADSSNHRIRRVTPNGMIATIAGSGVSGFSGDGDPATVARLHGPHSVAVDASGNLYVADEANHRIRSLSSSVVTTLVPDLTASLLRLVDRGAGQGVSLSLRVGNATLPTSSGPVSWWSGEGNTDDIADSNPGTLEGSVAYVPGKVGQAFQFNGSSQMRVPNAPNLRVSQGEFTTEAWVKFDALSGGAGSVPGDMSIFDTITGGVNVDGWRLAKQTDNRFWFCFGAGSNHCYDPAYTVFSTTRATTGVFYHVVAVKTATDFAIYINGNREDIRTLPPSFVDSRTSDLLIGANAIEGAHLIGLIDEPKIYNRALSAEEILAAYNGTSPSATAAEVAFYDGDPAAGGTLLGTTTAGVVPPGDFRDVVFNTTTPISGSHDLYAVVDPNNRIAECRKDNNSTHTAPMASVVGRITVSTDMATYGPGSPVVLQGVGTNTGTLAAVLSAELRVEDTNGALVQAFPVQSLGSLSSGASATVTQNWNTGSVLAGAYRLRGSLRDVSGGLIADATAPFNISINDPNCGQPAINMLVTAASVPGSDPAHLTPVLRYKFEGTGPLTALSSIPSYPNSLVNDPIYVTFSPQNELFVSNRRGNVPGTPGSIARFKFDAVGNFIANGAVTGNSLEAVHGIAFSPSGELFAVNILNSTISRFKFDPAGNAVPNGVFHSGTPHAQALAFSPSGELFITDSGGSGTPGVKRWRLDPVTGSPIANGFISWSGAFNPHGIGFSPNGELFVSDLQGNRVYRFRFDATGNAIDNGSITTPTPIGIAFSPAGELFVTSHGSGGISRFLFDQSGNAVANGVTPTPTLGGVVIKPIFRVEGGSCIASVATKVTTDKQIYEAWDTVNISGRVQNSAPNALLAPTRVELTVRSPSGQVLFTETRAVGQLTPLALRDLSFTLPLVDAVSGTYPVEFVLKDAAAGTVLSTATTSFQVNRREIQALTGTVAVTSAQVYQGDANRCTATAKNISSTMLSGVRLVHQLINVDAGTVVDEVSETVNLAAGGVVHNYFRDISTGLLAPGNYSCIIKAELGGDTKTLAFGGFQVLVPPIKIDATLKLGSKGRILVLLDPARSCGTNCADDTDPHGPDAAPGLMNQRLFLEALLKQAGWSYTLVESSEVFAQELRSGNYTLYALFNEQEKLTEQAQKELRETIFRGEGLLVAGTHDHRELHNNKLLDTLGIDATGNDPDALEVDLTASALNLTGRLTLLAGDQALRIQPLSAQSAGRYTQYSNGNATPDAVTLNTYGQGKAAFAAFDLLAMATLGGDQSLPAKLLLQTLGWATPQETVTLTGTVKAIDLTLTNQRIATEASAAFILPAGVTVLDAGGGQLTNNTLVFTTTLGVNEVKTLTFWVKLPSNAGTVTISASVTAPNHAGTLASPSLTLSVATRDLASISAMLDALLQASHPDSKALQQAKQSLGRAMSAASSSLAIQDLLKASDALLGLTNPDTVALRVAMGEWLRIAAQTAQ